MATSQTPFARAVEIAGSERKLAQMTGYSQNAIWHARRHQRCTAEMARAIERATGVTAAELRPDIFAAPE